MRLKLQYLASILGERRQVFLFLLFQAGDIGIGSSKYAWTVIGSPETLQDPFWTIRGQLDSGDFPALASEVTKFPQQYSNIEAPGDILTAKPVQDFINQKTEAYKEQVRILIRNSGTESKIRILTEGEDLKLVKALNNDIMEFLKKYISSVDK